MVFEKPLVSIRKDKDNPTRKEVLEENLLEAFIDGMIAGLMTGFLVDPTVSWKVALSTGLLKFFIKLKELRGKK